MKHSASLPHLCVSLLLTFIISPSNPAHIFHLFLQLSCLLCYCLTLKPSNVAVHTNTALSIVFMLRWCLLLQQSYFAAITPLYKPTNQFPMLFAEAMWRIHFSELKPSKFFVHLSKRKLQSSTWYIFHFCNGCFMGLQNEDVHSLWSHLHWDYKDIAMHEEISSF